MDNWEFSDSSGDDVGGGGAEDLPGGVVATQAQQTKPRRGRPPGVLGDTEFRRHRAAMLRNVVVAQRGQAQQDLSLCAEDMSLCAEKTTSSLPCDLKPYLRVGLGDPMCDVVVNMICSDASQTPSADDSWSDRFAETVTCPQKAS